MAKQEEKTPQEASNIFHSIMKASVKPNEINKEKLEKFKSAVKEKFGIEITIDNGIKYPKGTTDTTVIKVQKFYKEWNS